MDCSHLQTTDFNKICRCCLSSLKVGFVPFSAIYFEVFEAITSLQYNASDNLPKQICEQCTSQMDSIKLFAKICKESDSILNKIGLQTIKSELVDKPELKTETNSETNEDCLQQPKFEDISVNVKPDSDSLASNDCKPIKRKNRLRKTTDNERVGPTTCFTCKSKFPTKNLRDDHYKTSVFCKPKHHSCDICSKVCKTSWLLKVHRVKHFSERNFGCEVCSKTFKHKSNWQNHMKQHTEEKKHVCELCGLGFYQPYLLKYHMETHSDTKLYVCDHCGSSFKSIFTFNAHKLTHADGYKHNFQCSYCDKVLSSAATLTQHKTIHTGETNYLCTYCGKGCRTPRMLQRHVRNHTGERPYACPYCPKKFAEDNNLKDHINIHLGIRPHSCDLCGKSFTQGSHLRRHKLIHSGDKQFKCSVCDNKFMHAGNLKVHMKKHSGELQ